MAGVSALNTVSAMGYTITIPAWVPYVLAAIFVVFCFDLLARLIRVFCLLSKKEITDD